MNTSTAAPCPCSTFLVHSRKRNTSGRILLDAECRQHISLEVGKKYAASTIAVDYNGEEIEETLPEFTVVRGANGQGVDLDFGTGKNELAEFVCAFHKDRIRDDTITTDPYAMWWSSLRASVMLFWGYSWKWTFPGEDGLVLEKGFELED
jgi:hypothetical protein